VVLWTGAVVLVLVAFPGGGKALGAVSAANVADLPLTGLAGRVWLSVWGILAYFAIPLAVIVLVLRESPARFGLRLHVTRRAALLYAGVLALRVPVLVLASRSPAFLRKYPMVTDLDGEWTRLLLWEGVRGVRMFALEFFFRGFLLFGLERKLGWNAVALATLPYGLVHFGKPLPEAAGAILTGAILGTFALRTRSVFGGAIVHVLVASGMDVLALWRKDALPHL
jgi:membrane protease YdiL (CAAX protease family)